ncbi:methyltransferase [Kurthia zopfii]|uniref:Mg2+ transporter-C (MgtC) family protein n=1 Tax=Kurthia zopfii TaxID=1650 RepID=A0A2U3A959_9BACL|nr:MgtC/SapB family protein [Kurthia zopfii]PWI21045.1 protein sapB [Kurthia zopfii]TDR31617.1 putative Mg2+ transporter-C (MgtC) family protein [Kurthia zopfii]STX10412.1 putative Mg(2+) transport ATPase [Kurthia zopfii]VEI08622.1 putative Mg(2+) transport ATPase [Kurthia zopfii]GEK32425.1 methyltransferase [Kurthia zopfii]
MGFITDTPFLVESLLKMVIAASLSLGIGVERELKRKPVGLKTSLVIATFSCLLTIISVQSVFEATPVPGINVTMDPLRLAAQIVSGIGFLGAGVILKRTDDSISGLTTAAMIWGAAGIGIAVGAGFYIPAIVAVLIVLFGVEVIAPIFTRLGPERLRMQEINVIIRLEQSDDIEKVIDYLKANDFLLEGLIIKDTRDLNHDLIHEIHIRFSSLPEQDTLNIYTRLKSLPFIDDIEVSIL